MSSNDYQTPDLASILRTLASLAPQNQHPRPQNSTQDHSTSLFPQTHEPQQPEWQQIPAQIPPVTQASTPLDVPKTVDPATIIDWSAGLRCIMKTVAKHENIIHDIRRMIKVQHEHEEQWWKGRETLIERQKVRKEGQKKLDDVLRLVGGTVGEGTSNNSPEELAKELETFDMKVYRAQTQMVKEMNAKMRSLGIPFFGTKTELVRIAGKDGTGGSGVDAPKDEKRMIDEVELVKLQRKMLAILEDLCRE